MRNTGPFTQYNRAIARRKPPTEDGLEIDKSLLGLFGASEAVMLVKLLVDPSGVLER